MMGKTNNKMGWGWLLLLLLPLAAACAAPRTETPPATLQAVLSSSPIWEGIDHNHVAVLQEQALGSGQLLLYQWQNESAETCLATAYLINLNGEWQTHDTFYTACHAEPAFLAAHSGNSTAESPYGPARFSTAYGVSKDGHAVRVVWADGQVSYIPLQNGSFLVARNGNIAVERVELVDSANNVLTIEDWQGSTLN
ncbi:MAG: hypothetical protein IPL28_15445 [Chloroflexi bacterium]|nr:hypothetical protein [Chloroflexota bacterium]